MQVKVETTEGLGRRMRIVVPAERVESRVAEKLKEAARSANLKGFRPGKAPLTEIRRRFGASIRQDVSAEVIEATWGEALQQEAINPAGWPSIEDIVFAEGRDLEYTAVFEVFPVIELKPFSDISVERPVCSITEADIDRMVQNLREQRGYFKEVERPCVAGDRIEIEHEGFLDGQPAAALEARGVRVRVGPGPEAFGLGAGLAGLAAGEERELQARLPDDYEPDALAGREATFRVRVNSVTEFRLPELDAEFFAEWNLPDGASEADFRKEVRALMERELEVFVRKQLREQVMTGLALAHDISLPEALVAQEADGMRQAGLKQFGLEGKADSDMFPADVFSEQAERRVKLGLIVNAIIEQKELRLDNARVRDAIEKLASQYEEPELMIEHCYNDERQLAHIQNSVLDDQVVDLVLESAQVAEKVVHYLDLMAPPNHDEAHPDAGADTAAESARGDADAGSARGDGESARGDGASARGDGASARGDAGTASAAGAETASGASGS